MKNQIRDEHWKMLVLFLKEIAIDKGITQEQIAEDTGLIQSNVSRFFSLKYKPNLDTFLSIARSIKVNFYFEDQESATDLNRAFERAMSELGRRDDFSKN